MSGSLTVARNRWQSNNLRATAYRRPLELRGFEKLQIEKEQKERSTGVYLFKVPPGWPFDEKYSVMGSPITAPASFGGGGCLNNLGPCVCRLVAYIAVSYGYPSGGISDKECRQVKGR
ncbi:hypothetical protein WN48_01470 [Eufriesea mexicana]|nr:hypothetical protein WN48_01470 [Eufriesea mexicana]